ncbi:hypothetical protein NGA35_06405 [Pseudomonas stutzeri]|nr:hypothetical protein [Stutzerimonas stutzeri]
MNEPQLKSLLDDLDSANAAADGLSRLVVTRLAEKRIPYRAMLGTVELDGKRIYPHFWVEADGCLIDYRACRLLGDDERLPHGVIAKDRLQARYEGTSIVIDPLPDYLFEQLVH